MFVFVVGIAETDRVDVGNLMRCLAHELLRRGRDCIAEPLIGVGQ